ncbi:MAG: S9 family peptidase [Reichenbachiella sp.]|uniref:S9 family peptidase n=1 Tax=Reichenbachiella sp. TaxID=2184521 RepID=UPI00326383AE
MKPYKQFAIILLFLAIEATGQSKIPFQQMDVFELEWASDPQVSPDGKWNVYLRNRMNKLQDKRERRIWIVDHAGNNHRKLTPNDHSESSPRWSPNGTRIAYTSSTDEGSEIFVYWMESGQHARLTQLDRSPSNISWSPDGKWLTFSMLVPEKPPYMVNSPSKPKGAQWADEPRVTTRVRHEADGSGFIEPGYYHYFIIPADGGTARQITSGRYQHKNEPQWTKDGKSLIFSANRREDWEYNYRNSEIYSVSLSDGSIQELTERNGPDYDPVVSPNGNNIAYLGYEDKIQTYQLPELYVMNLNGSGKRMIDLKLDRRMSNLTWNQKGTGLYFLYDSEGNTKIGFVSLDGKFEKVKDDVGGTGVARPYGGGSFSISNNDLLVYNMTTPYFPADLASGKKGDSSIRRITRLNEDLLAYRELGKVEEIWYNSSFDNRKIQGWIVKPPQFDPGKQYPMIVENHGGPIANYGDRFSPEMQLYASAGYVVFYPNPRGSTSYGEEFGNLLYHNYPGQDYDDVMSGVDAVLAEGYVHQDSLFVTGGSAGGIMTAWIIGKSKRFRAAAVIKPVMNWYSKTLVADNWNGYFNYRYPGYPWENPETYMKFSPISLVGNIETPTLVMVGTSDLRTPLSEAKQLYHALKIRKIETALVEMPGAYHFIARRPSQLIGKIDHIVAWFNQFR